jgi:hypothetical protein
LFRQAPARAQSYVAERLQKEGWFDESGWALDANRSGRSRWFPDRRDLVIGEGPLNGTADVWTAAFNMWRDDGLLNGIYLDPTEETKLQELAGEFRTRYQIRPSDNADAFRPETMPSPRLAESLIAHRRLLYRSQNLTMTNYSSHYYRAEAERDRDTIQARKLMYEANQCRKDAELERAIDTYQKAFDLWKNVLSRESFLEFRNSDQTQADTYEAQYNYVEVLSELRGGQLRPALIARDVLTEGALASLSGQTPSLFYTGLIYGLVNDRKALPLPLPGPFDGNAPDGRPWITDDVVATVRTRLGLEVAAPRIPPPSTAEPPIGR